MALQAYIDDSYTPDGYYVLAGFIATEETWAKFSEAWKEMLPYGTLADDNTHHFKMSEMALSSERIERAAAFYRIIEAHDLYPLAAAFRIQDLHNAIDRIYSINVPIDRDRLRNKFLIGFKLLMEGAHAGRMMMPDGPFKGEVIDFIFDEAQEKKMVFAAWENYLAGKDLDLRRLYGNVPRFGDDKVFLPLQAADLLAWWHRKGYEDNAPSSVKDPIFGIWERKKEANLGYFFKMDEDNITVNLLRDLRAAYPGGAIYDTQRKS